MHRALPITDDDRAALNAALSAVSNQHAVSPLALKNAMQARLDAFGVVGEANNYGGLRCLLPYHDHDHEDNGACLAHPGTGTRIRVYGTPDVGALELAHACARQLGSTLNLSDPPDVGAYVSLAPAVLTEGDPRWLRVRSVGGIAQVGIWPFGPSAEAESTFRGLLADWESYEKSGVPRTVLTNYQKIYAEEWIPFRDAWLKGEPNVEKLSAQVNYSNTVRKDLKEKFPKGEWGAIRQGTDIESATPAMKLGKTVDDEVKAATNAVKSQVTTVVKDLTVGQKIAIGIGALALLGGGIYAAKKAVML